MKKSRIILALVILLISSLNLVKAQDKNEPNKEQKKEKRVEIKEPYLFWGGSLWFGFGSYTYVDVNALFGTQLTERFSIGLSGKYQYYKENGTISTGTLQTFETNVYGGSLFTQYAVIKDFRNLFKVKGHSGIIAHAEYEFLNTDYNYVHFDVANSNKNRYWLHNILIGGGYFQQMGKKAKSYIILLWNVNKTTDNPYEYPQLRIGFSLAI